MAHVKINHELLRRFCLDAFEKFGFSREDSEIITDVLQMSDFYGIESHGMQRLTRYDKGIQSGLIKVDAKPEIVFETPVSAVIDGHDGMGQLNGHFAMETAIRKAEDTGVAFVTVRNSNHYGIAGYYAKMACDKGMIGMSCTNSEAIMVPTNGRVAMLGSNPIAIAVPADPYPFLFDASTTVVTRGKLEMYRKAEKPIHDGWAVDKNGVPTNDPGDVLDSIKDKTGGGILPLGRDKELSGSHKGYGYGMICEIFSSILSQGLTSNHTHIGGKGGTSHGFAVINPTIFGNPEDIKAGLSTFLEELRATPVAPGRKQVFTHGEKEHIAEPRIKAEGVPVDEKTVLEMMSMADYLKMDFNSYFGDLGISNHGYQSAY